MKKVILSLALVSVLAIAIALYYVLTNLDAIVKAAIEKYGSQATQTAVRVEKVRIDLTDGAGAIDGLTVANPKGFALSHAFTLGEISTKIDLKSLQKEPYVIEQITVRAPQVFVEINEEKKTNLNELKKKLSVGKPGDKHEQEADKTAAAQPRLIIKRLNFEQGSIAAKVTPLKKDYDLKLPSLNMTNLGGSKGATATELAKEILQRLTDAAKAEIKKQGIDAEIDKIKAKAQEKVDTEKAKLKDKVDSKKEAEKQKVEDKLKGLFEK